MERLQDTKAFHFEMNTMDRLMLGIRTVDFCPPDVVSGKHESEPHRHG